MEGLADNGYQAAALAIADRLTTAQLTTLNGSFYLQGAMDGIASSMGSDGQELSAATVAANVANFMAHIGAYVDPEGAGQAMEDLADNGNQVAALAIADRLTTAQLTALSTDGNFDLGNTLSGSRRIHLPDGTPIDLATLTANIVNFMAHDGAYVDPESAGLAMEMLAQNGYALPGPWLSPIN